MSRRGLRRQNQTTQPLVSSTNMNIETINKPSSLCTVLHGLSDAQKSDIMDMGFESIKSFSINKIPSRLGSWLLANYDHKSNVLKVGDGIINITPLKVYEIFGVPNGTKPVHEKHQARRGSPRYEWRKQFTGDKICVEHVIEKVLSDREGGRLFKLNFLVVFNSMLAESNKSATVNQKCLSSIENEADIPNMDWCGYIVACLKRTKEEWDGKLAYNGPLTFLAVLYAHEQQMKLNPDYAVTPAIEYVSDEYLEDFEKEVLPIDEDTQMLLHDDGDDDDDGGSGGPTGGNGDIGQGRP
ncbi:uncharacterized protein LOC118488025 [Helianthus annuus]|uniref:uncharacterized protein LOC118488025 n=1 Tax=Helianthus annuus TaxID=4232 RepID=UPI001652C5BD|nr:uncharacterized protein LOC118488025 [Helianthus annuus]